MKPLCPYRNSVKLRSFPSLARGFITPEKGQGGLPFLTATVGCYFILSDLLEVGPLNVTQKKAVGSHSAANKI